MNPILLASGSVEVLPLIAGALGIIFFIAAIVRTINVKRANARAAERAEGIPQQRTYIGIHDPYKAEPQAVPPASEAATKAPQVFTTEASPGTSSAKPTSIYVWE